MLNPKCVSIRRGDPLQITEQSKEASTKRQVLCTELIRWTFNCFISNEVLFVKFDQSDLNIKAVF